MCCKLLLASAGAIALTASAALAADLPSRAPPPVFPPPPPIFTWTGIYLGGQIGYAWGTDNVSWSGTSNDDEAAFGTFSSNPQGVIGGAHVGYNLQINQWVVGLEGTVDGTSLTRTDVVGANDVFGDSPGSFTATSRADIQGSIRGRAGVAWDRALLYATGGVAFTRFNTNIDDTTGFFAGVGPGGTASFSNTRVGWTVGGGIEYAVTNNWLIRAEYRYSDFGHIPNTAFDGAATLQHRLTQNQVQVGFSYKFDTWTPYPVVAKY